MRGPIVALIAAVEKRSYSRNSGSTSEEVQTNASGSRARTISAARRSCASFR